MSVSLSVCLLIFSFHFFFWHRTLAFLSLSVSLIPHSLLNLIHFCVCCCTFNSESQEQFICFFILCLSIVCVNTSCVKCECAAHIHIFRIEIIACTGNFLTYSFRFPDYLQYTDKCHNGIEQTQFIANDVIFHHILVCVCVLAQMRWAMNLSLKIYTSITYCFHFSPSFSKNYSK